MYINQLLDFRQRFYHDGAKFVVNKQNEYLKFIWRRCNEKVFAGI